MKRKNSIILREWPTWTWKLLIVLSIGLLVAVGLLGGRPAQLQKPVLQMAAEQEWHRATRSAPESMLSSFGAEPPSSQPAKSLDRETLLRIGQAYHEGKNNIGFNEEQTLREIAARGPAFFSLLRSELLSAEALAELPEKQLFSTVRPSLARDRMALIDLAEGFLEHHVDIHAQKAATNLLQEVAARPIPKDLPEAARRELLGENFDSLTVLARRNRELAFQTFAHITSSGQKRQLFTALMLGLMDSGVSTSEIEQILKPYAPPG